MASQTAMLFPGQGSQSVGMMAELSAGHPQVADTFGEASEVLGYDLWSVVCKGPSERLNRTEVTQPAILAADIATWRIWSQLGGSGPDFFAGHSLGEYAALVAAEALRFTEAIELVAQRGRLMQQATPEGTGAMAAILGLEDGQIETICEDAAQGQIVSCANFNSPGQVVIAGQTEAVERACQASKEAGARRAIVLPVSVPSHCALMKSAADALEPMLASLEIRTPSTPVVQNVDARPHTDPEEIRNALVAQLWQPVLWTATVQHLAGLGVARMAECGPGKVLVGLSRRIARELPCAALVDDVAIKNTIDDWSNHV
jgi:[acyl-carrier-protein] S-malonyltransferase